MSSRCYSSSCSFWSKTCICLTRHLRHTFLIFKQFHIFLSSAWTVSSSQDFGVEQIFRADEFWADDPSPKNCLVELGVEINKVITGKKQTKTVNKMLKFVYSLSLYLKQTYNEKNFIYCMISDLYLLKKFKHSIKELKTLFFTNYSL